MAILYHAAEMRCYMVGIILSRQQNWLDTYDCEHQGDIYTTTYFRVELLVPILDNDVLYDVGGSVPIVGNFSFTYHQSMLALSLFYA